MAIIIGNNFVNNLNGTVFADYIFGLGANDTLNGSLGRDIMVGGLGNDTFDYDFVSESPVGFNRDIITDFQGNGPFAGDVINLAGIDANLFVAGNQAFSLAQLSYVGGILTANVFGGPDLQINLLGAPLDIVGVTNDVIL